MKRARKCMEEYEKACLNLKEAKVEVEECERDCFDAALGFVCDHLHDKLVSEFGDKVEYVEVSPNHHGGMFMIDFKVSRVVRCFFIVGYEKIYSKSVEINDLSFDIVEGFDELQHHYTEKEHLELAAEINQHMPILQRLLRNDMYAKAMEDIVEMYQDTQHFLNQRLK